MSDPSSQDWNPAFFQASRLFETIEACAKTFAELPDWPGLNDFNAVFEQAGLSVRPVAQAEKPVQFDELYESRIYLKGELQTRLGNWHDFFNALVWLTFPRTKTVLNRLHFLNSKQREEKTNRSPLENAITLFDECGAIVISKRDELLQMIREHRWKELFVENRDAFGSDITCIIFGHAMYEKALDPYIGMTTNTLLIRSADLMCADVQTIDAYLASCWEQGGIRSTRDLKPFPVLGVPGWYAQNENPAFYDNREYFRPGRK